MTRAAALVGGFGDELGKLGAARTFPLARFLTAPWSLREAARGLLTGGSAGHAVAGPVGAAVGGAVGAAGGLMRGVGHSLAQRRNFARSTLARLGRGGGLMEHEKNRLAEGLGLSRERFDRVTGHMQTRHRYGDPGGHEDALSRFANTKANPLAALQRFVEARALAGRLAKGEPLLEHEQRLVDAVRAQERAERVKDVLTPAAQIAAGLGAAGGAGYGGYRALRRWRERHREAS